MEYIPRSHHTSPISRTQLKVNFTILPRAEKVNTNSTARARSLLATSQSPHPRSYYLTIKPTTDTQTVIHTAHISRMSNIITTPESPKHYSHRYKSDQHNRHTSLITTSPTPLDLSAYFTKSFYYPRINPNTLHPHSANSSSISVDSTDDNSKTQTIMTYPINFLIARSTYIISLQTSALPLDFIITAMPPTYETNIYNLYLHDYNIPPTHPLNSSYIQTHNNSR